jgi:hypothetical protein
MWENLGMTNRIRPEDLVGAYEIAERAGLAFPNLVHTWRRRHKDFPQPIAELHAGLIWEWPEVEKWLRQTSRSDN